MSQNDPIERFARLLQDKTDKSIRKAKREAMQASVALSLPATLVVPDSATGEDPIFTIEDTSGNTLFRILANGIVETCIVRAPCSAIVDPDGAYIADPDGNYIEALRIFVS